MKHEVHEHVLGNGAKGLVLHVPGVAVCNMVAYFNSGFMFTDKRKYELPHVMEHLMGSGNELYPTAVKFKTEVEKNGAYRNASTSPYLNGYVYECAGFERDRMMQLLAAQISRPLFPAVSLPTEISNVREELSRNTTDYGRVVWNILNEETFPVGALGLGKRIEQLASITREDVVSYYARTHTAANLRFFFAGDFPDGGEAFVRKFESQVERMPRGEYLPFIEQKPVLADRPIIEHHDIKQLYYMARLTAKGGLEPRLEVAMSVLRALMVQGYRSWVMGEARERGLAYGVGMSAGVSPSMSEWGFNGYVTYENATELFGVMVKHMKRVRSGEIPAADLAATKALMIGSATRSQQTAGDLLGWYASNYVFEDRIYPITEHYDDIEKITKSDVVEALDAVSAGGSHGVSFVGTVSKKLAGTYEEVLSPLWAR